VEVAGRHCDSHLTMVLVIIQLFEDHNRLKQLSQNTHFTDRWLGFRLEEQMKLRDRESI
jgi:hypothetical protein